MAVISSGGFVHHYSHLLHKTSDWFVIHCRCDNIYNQAESFFIYTCKQRLFLLFLGSVVSWKQNLLPRSGLVLCLFTGMRVRLTGGLSWMLAMDWCSITPACLHRNYDRSVWDADPGHVGDDPKLTEKGQGLEQKWGSQLVSSLWCQQIHVLIGLI